MPPTKGKEGYESRATSLYGRETYYDAPQAPYTRSFSPVPSYNQGRGQSAYGFPQAHPADPFGRQSVSGGQSRRATSYLPELNAGDQFGSPELVGSPGGIPTDAELERVVQDVLRDADLTTTTKRAIRAKLEEMFGMDLSSRKAVINAAVDRTLSQA